MTQRDVSLYWRDYKFFPYERSLGYKEIKSLLKGQILEESDDKLLLRDANEDAIRQLVYFSHAKVNEDTIPTNQYQLESGLYGSGKRQNTRYSVHGLHEYKGKFNPQIVKALFNVYSVTKGQRILDPFCGSGTTLVEAAHNGIYAYGADINPLAVFIANTKIKALSLEVGTVQKATMKLIKMLSRSTSQNLDFDDLRLSYLKKWFPTQNLLVFESLRKSVATFEPRIRDIFLVAISNILREYSLQEPSDLRIRRRKSPMPEVPIEQEVERTMNRLIEALKSFQSNFGTIESLNAAFNLDITKSESGQIQGEFDFAITSPPYATALPYIDTNRLSLVWLDLIPASSIKLLESELTGSREFNQKSDETYWNQRLDNNEDNLPKSIHEFCLNLKMMIHPTDGFRKRSLPALLYRYFCCMRLAFLNVHRCLKDGSRFCLIVGHNHTRIGNVKTDIDTPVLLTYIGEQIGFRTEEVVPLEVYQRYGLNSLNAVQKESLIVFNK